MKPDSHGSVLRRVLTSIVIGLLLGAVGPVRAQGPGYPAPRTAPTQVLSADQLDNLVAPIALYPDPLLSQVLVACTYPLELVEAQQWLKHNDNLRGTALMDAARNRGWDASVQAMVALPEVLSKLNQDIRWTKDLGNAFLAQQADVMSAVQRMRVQAKARGTLSSSPQQTVATETEDGQTAITIEPTAPDVIYVPAYDPMYVWGPPVWGVYPPLLYPGFGFGFGPGIDIGLCFDGWGGWGFGGWVGWGWGPNWFGGSIFVNNNFFGRYGFRGYGGGGFNGRGIWSHDPIHRLGVPYPNRQLSGRFQAASVAGARASLGRPAMRSSFGEAYGPERGAYRPRQAGPSQYAGRSFAGRAAMPGNQRFRGAVPPQGNSRSYSQAPQRFQSRPSFPSAPGMSGPRFGGFRGSPGGTGRGFGGFGAGRSFGGGGGHFGGGGHGGGRR